MRMNHTVASSVIVVDAPTASGEVIVRHSADARTATEQRPIVAKRQRANVQAPMAVFYDDHDHVVHVQVLRQQHKWVAEVGYQAGFFIPDRDGLIRGESSGIALVVEPVRVIDLQCFSATQHDYLLVAFPNDVEQGITALLGGAA